MNTLFIKTYTEQCFFRGKVWVCQPTQTPWSNKLQRPSYEGGGSGDTQKAKQSQTVSPSIATVIKHFTK